MKSLWTRASKKVKTASTSTPNLQTAESRVQRNSPSVHLETHNETEEEPATLPTQNETEEEPETLTSTEPEPRGGARIQS